jgi:hypothetical protein
VGGQDGQQVGFADHLCVGKLSQRPGKAHGVCFSHCFGTQAKPHPQTLTPSMVLESKWCSRAAAKECSPVSSDS